MATRRGIAMRKIKHVPQPEPTVETSRISEEIDKITFGASALQHELGPVESPRFGRIVAATDGGSASGHVAEWTQAVADAYRGRVWAATILEPQIVATGGVDPSPDEGARERAAWAAVERLGTSVGRAASTTDRVVRHGFPVPQIADLAKEVGADLVIVGSHRSSTLERVVLGSVADGVKNQVHASVLLARSKAPPGSVILATDGSTSSKRAAGVALHLARAWKVELLVLHAFRGPLSGDMAANEDKFRQTFQDSHVRPWTDPEVTFETRLGRPADVVKEAVREYDNPLVVCGSRGLSGLRALVPGSVSNRFAHVIPTSVLIVK